MINNMLKLENNKKKNINGGFIADTDEYSVSLLNYTNIIFLIITIAIVLFIIENFFIIICRYFTDYLLYNINFNIDSWIDFKLLFFTIIFLFYINYFILDINNFYIYYYSTIIIIITKNFIKNFFILFNINLPI